MRIVTVRGYRQTFLIFLIVTMRIALKLNIGGGDSAADQSALSSDVHYADKLLHCLATCFKRQRDAKTAAEMEYWDLEYHRCSQELLQLKRKAEEVD